MHPRTKLPITGIPKAVDHRSVAIVVEWVVNLCQGRIRIGIGIQVIAPGTAIIQRRRSRKFITENVSVLQLY